MAIMMGRIRGGDDAKVRGWKAGRWLGWEEEEEEGGEKARGGGKRKCEHGKRQQRHSRVAREGEEGTR